MSEGRTGGTWKTKNLTQKETNPESKGKREILNDEADKANQCLKRIDFRNGQIKPDHVQIIKLDSRFSWQSVKGVWAPQIGCFSSKIN